LSSQGALGERTNRFLLGAATGGAAVLASLALTGDAFAAHPSPGPRLAYPGITGLPATSQSDNLPPPVSGKRSGNYCETNPCGWQDGPLQSTSVANFFGVSGTEYFYTGYWGNPDDATFPKTGDHYYAHIVISLAGNPCNGGDIDFPQIALPSGTTFDSGNTVEGTGTHCFYDNYGTGTEQTGQYSDCTNTGAGWTSGAYPGCSSNCWSFHTPSSSGLGGGIAVPSYGLTNVVFPITSSTALNAYSMGARIGSALSGSYFTPTALVFVPSSAPTTHQLSISKAGSGSGTVTSTSDNGINCGSTCSHSYSSGSSVTLHAAPASGSTFAGWSGSGCSGTGDCVVAMNSNQSVTASFSASGGQPPNTTITSAKVSAGKRKATFKFSGSGGSGALTYSCSLDGAALKSCTSPTSYTHLKAGKHTFSVRAKDGTGATDPSPASKSFKI